MTPGCGALGVATNDINGNNITLYPNPFSNTLSVNIAESGTYEMFLYSVTGATIMQKTLTSRETTLDVNVPAGMYFYRIIGANGTVSTGKLMSAK